ncbi:VOC family protein [Paenibacillus radicis (ex Gao et al. 2016)]|uniref:VOC family protein n=1 Tax=Paenibacillus radicis (ex Gao et al. 2016) TaxID=1737354 RepID=UPI001663CDA0|nr:VOC family protein [Paenibacillus radicis (ex Gao et al. 2016)]
MAFAFKGIDHVQLAAPEGCEQEARAFYARLLGWRELEKPDSLKKRGGVWFQCGPQQVHIGVQTGFTPARKAHPAFGVCGITELQSWLQAHGVETIADDSRQEEGAERFYVNDPFGNRLEFMEWEREVNGKQQ